MSLVTVLQLSASGYHQLTASPAVCLAELKSQTELQHHTLLYNLQVICYLIGNSTQEEMDDLWARKLRFRRASIDPESIATMEKAVLLSNELHEFMRHPDLERIGMASTYHINK